jgi:hypothetical protein
VKFPLLSLAVVVLTLPYPIYSIGKNPNHPNSHIVDGKIDARCLEAFAFMGVASNTPQILHLVVSPEAWDRFAAASRENMPEAARLFMGESRESRLVFLKRLAREGSPRVASLLSEIGRTNPDIALKKELTEMLEFLMNDRTLTENQANALSMAADLNLLGSGNHRELGDALPTLEKDRVAQQLSPEAMVRLEEFILNDESRGGAKLDTLFGIPSMRDKAVELAIRRRGYVPPCFRSANWYERDENRAIALLYFRKILPKQAASIQRSRYELLKDLQFQLNRFWSKDPAEAGKFMKEMLEHSDYDQKSLLNDLQEVLRARAQNINPDAFVSLVNVYVEKSKQLPLLTGSELDVERRAMNAATKFLYLEHPEMKPILSGPLNQLTPPPKRPKSWWRLW